ncbi:MAG: D-2-hydroxyacid dehydrogenase [Polyangiaceae bacterium]|nr:D-2-hydroxyacid dehydrogenase [Polyangiaceae bacterium]
MKIAVLDADPAFGSASCPAELRGTPRLQALEELGSLAIFQRTLPSELLTHAAGAEVVLTNKVPLGEEEFAQLPQLKFVSILATGYNIIDLEAAQRRGVLVSNVPGYSTHSTAQHALALLLELCHGVGTHNQSVQSGEWQSSPAFAYYRTPLVELAGKTLGIFGLGAIGRQMARLGRALGMKVICNTRTVRDDEFENVPFSELLKRSDVLSLHAPLTEATHQLINEQSLQHMKKGAFLLNVARGPLLDEKAVAKALHEGQLGGVGIDVLTSEPPRQSSPLIGAPRCMITPHIAWATAEARQRLIDVSVENIRTYLQGAPQNLVS